MNSANAIDFNNVDLGKELSAIKKDLDQGFLHFNNINSEQNNRYIGYFILILATNIEGFTTSCLHEITKIKNIPENLDTRHLNAFNILHSIYSINKNLSENLEETIKEILEKRHPLAHGRRGISIDQSLLMKYHEATLEYLELIKTNTEDLLYRCSG
ncbi:MAG: hypothetical protein EBR67_00700 [Proteobacteria bacterium]|nr:hypothetical protein [Pseudomonadota bacterium]